MKDSLEGHPDQLFLQTLANDYAELVRTANLRLEQCALMISKGNEFQAVQLAEVHPPLLDLVATLSFPGLDQWKTVCISRNLKLPERVDERSVRALNEVYQKGLSPTHPLYKQYRAAMFDRNDDAALDVLLTIVRMNATDQVAKTELDRLRKRVVDKKIELLKTTLAGGDTTESLKVLENLERISPTLPSDPSIDKARQLQQARVQQEAAAECEKLIQQLEPFHDADNIKPALPMIETVFARRIDLNVTFRPEIEQLFRDSHSWLSTLRSRALTMALDEARTTEFTNWADEAAAEFDKLSSLDATRLQDLKEEVKARLAQIHHPTETIRKRSDKLIELIRDEQRARIRVGKQRMIAMATLAIVATLGLGYLIIAYTQSSSIITEFERNKEMGRVNHVKELLDHHGAWQQITAPFVTQSKLAEYRSWVGEARTQLDTVEQTIADLESRVKAGLDNSPMEETSEAISRMKRQMEGLPENIRPELASRATELERKWNEFSRSRQSQILANFNSLLTDADKLVETIDYQKSPASQADNQKKLEGILNKAESLSSNPPLSGEIDSSALDKIKKLQIISAELSKEVNLALESEKNLKTITSFENYAVLIRRLGDGKFGNEDIIRAARTIARKNQFITDPVADLLLPDNPAGWNYFKQNPDAAPIPPDASPNEIRDIVELRNNPLLQNVFLHTVRYYPSRSQMEKPQSTKQIYSKGELAPPQERGIQDDRSVTWSGEFYDPAASPETLIFSQRDIKGFRNNVAKIASGELIVESHLTPESEAFTRLGMDRIYDPEKKAFTRPIISLLDQLRDSSTVSPLERAYIHYQLLEIASGRPQEWGLHLTPVAQLQRKKLHDILQVPLGAGDWMLPNRKKQLEASLKDFYAAVNKQPRLFTQFKFHRSLLSQTLKGGVNFAGYVGLNGKPVLQSAGLGAKEIWGLRKDGDRLVLLYTWNENSKIHDVKVAAQPLSALLVFGSERARVLKDAAREAEIADEQLPPYLSFLPDYFQGL